MGSKDEDRTKKAWQETDDGAGSGGGINLTCSLFTKDATGYPAKARALCEGMLLM